jgi:DNA primase
MSAEDSLYPKKDLSGTLLVECNLDAEAGDALGENVLAAGGMDLSTEQLEELRRRLGPIYVLPDDDALGGAVPRRWVRYLYPKAYLCPAEYGKGIEDLSDLVRKRGEAVARKVLRDLKARAVDALELALSEAPEDSGQARYRYARERVLPLLSKLEARRRRRAKRCIARRS